MIELAYLENMTSISKNFKLGERIKSIDEIESLALQGKSVMTLKWGIRPAAFVYRMSYQTVIEVIRNFEIFRTVRK